MVDNIVYLNDYKRKKGIALSRSPYSTLDATSEQLEEARLRAIELMQKPFDYRGQPPFAVVTGYKNVKTGKIKLLKEFVVFPTREVLFSTLSAPKGHECLILAREKIQ